MASYVNSLFRSEIIRDLELKRHGFAMLPRSPSSFTPLPDGRLSPFLHACREVRQQVDLRANLFMSVLELTDEQVLSLIGQLPSAKKRAALLALARDAGARREERMAYAEAQLRQRARERGLDWDTLDEAGREALINRLLHEA